MRTIITLPEDQVKGLAELCERQNISRAEAIRLSIAEYLKSKTLPKDADMAFGLWKDKPIDALDYEDTLRSEW